MQNTVNPNALVQVDVFLEGGKHYTTSVNAAVSNDRIDQYFIGQKFTQDDETSLRCVAIRITR